MMVSNVLLSDLCLHMLSVHLDEDLLRGTKLEISALQVQVIEMQGVIRDQTSLIRLLGTKLRSRSQGTE